MIVKLLITWVVISLICGFITKVKVNGVYITGIKRFVIGFIFAIPITIMLALFVSFVVPMIIVLMIAVIMLGMLRIVV